LVVYAAAAMTRTTITSEARLITDPRSHRVRGEGVSLKIMVEASRVIASFP
jgi:hypothetical protein